MSHLRTNKRTNRGQREREIVEWALALDAAYPTMERVYAKEDAPPSAVTGAILNRVHGAVEAGFAPRDWLDIPQGTVKSIVVGRGGSDVTKQDVEIAVRSHLRLPLDFTFATDDEADAVAVGLAYLALGDALPVGYETLQSRLTWWLTKDGAGKALNAKTRKEREKLRAEAMKRTETIRARMKGGVAA